MRISTRQIQQLGIDSILAQQEKLSRTQQQVATGKRVLLPSDDPVATTQLLQLRQSIETTEQYQANADAAINRLQQEEGVLTSITEILQSVRVLAVQGNNASQTNETRSFMAEEIRQRIEELVGLANTRDGTGDYLFAGTQGDKQPFVKNSQGGYDYKGDQNVRYLQIGAGRKVADGDAGSAVFQLIRSGNGAFETEVSAANQGTGVIDGGSVIGEFVPSIDTTVVPRANGYTLEFFPDPIDGHLKYRVFDATGAAVELGNPAVAGTTEADYVEGAPIEFAGARVSVSGTPANGDTFTVRSSEYQDIFETLERLASALDAPVRDPAERAHLNNAISRALGDIDETVDNILVVRAGVGSRLNAIESQVYVNEGYLIQAQETLSSVEDLDYAEAISRLHMQMAGLEAAQQTYLKVNGLSIFNYLR